MTAFDPINEASDYAVIGGVITPGICRITGLSKPKRLDEQAGPGYSGGYLIFRGMKLARWTMEIALYSPEDYAAWGTFYDYIREPKSAVPVKRMAFDVWHPVLVSRGVSSMMIEDVKGPDQSLGDTVSTVTLVCVEFRLPKLQMSKPDSPQPAAAPDAGDVAVEAKRQELLGRRGVSAWGKAYE